MLFFSHLFLKLFVLHCALHFQGLHFLHFHRLLLADLDLLLLYTLHEIFCLLSALTQQMKAIAPDLSFFLLNHTRNAIRPNH